ncbi:MAG: trimethylamine methyltransferase family protein [Elusimicrobia bacterium]|nr:trimethylamine methyltransferase family protein [Elusimicrobiota bacterium]
MRPKLRFLSDDLAARIVSEARDLLAKVGVAVLNDEARSLLSDHGAKVDLAAGRVTFPPGVIDQALKSVPRSFKLYDVLGVETNDFSEDKVHFTPGSSTINFLDSGTWAIRKPSSEDYVRYAKLMSRLGWIASQSTAFIPTDVHERVSDSYRLYLSLLYCEKPVVTGTFTARAFQVMRDLQLAVRGSDAALRAKPLTVFSACPTSPLKWSGVTSQTLLDCARAGVPVEYIAMPLTGFMAPVTLVGTLVQHTAETLSGVAISQFASPGAPALYGGSPAAFDVRYETTPMGAAETQMTDCAITEIGHSLGFPTQAYIGMSDSKELDAQAGLETAMGATLAVLSGINNVSGPGILDFENCQSLEKLVLDNEVCGLALRLARGIEPKDDFPSTPLFEELNREGHLLIAKHTRKHLKGELHYPGPVIDRANHGRWKEEGGLPLLARAKREVDAHLKAYAPSRLPAAAKADLTRIMESEARRHGMDRLPRRPG